MTIALPSAALVRRELLTSLRKRRFFAVLVLVLGGVFLTASPFLLSARYMDPGMMGASLQGLTTSLYYLFLFVACIMLPATAGTSICLEKQRGSYDLLATTLIRPFGVVTAKMFNALGVYLLIVIAGFPVFGLVFFFAGVDLGQFALSWCIVLSHAVAVASAGVFCSAWFYRSTAAMVGGYVITVLLVGGLSFLLMPLLMMPGAFTGPQGVPAFAWMFALPRLLSPITALAAANLGGLGPRGFLTWEVYISIPFQFADALFFLFLAARIHRRQPKPQRVDTTRIIDDPKQLETRRKKWPYYLFDPARRRAAIRDGSNPMFAKERYAGLLGRMTWRIRAFYLAGILCFACSLPLTISLVYGGGEGQVFYLLLVAEFTVALLVIPPTVATAITREFELGNLDMLRSTLLRPREILMGKLFACFSAIAPVGFGVVIGNGVIYFLLREIDAVAWVFGAFAYFFVAACLATSVSVYAALLSRRQVTAMGTGFIANLVVFVGPLVLASAAGLILEEFMPVADAEYIATLGRTLLPTPLGGPWRLLEGPVHPSQVGAATFNHAICLAFAGLLFAASLRRFAQTRMRER